MNEAMEDVLKTLEQAKVTARLAIAFAAEQGYTKHVAMIRDELQQLDKSIADVKTFMIDSELSRDRFMAACKKSADELTEQHGIRLEYRPDDRRYYAYHDGKFLWSGEAWFNVANIALALAHGRGQLAQNMPPNGL